MKSQVILIVEDNPITRKMAKVALEGGGYTVLEAQDAQSCLDLARQQKASLILQDLFLPDMDGIALLRELRSLPDCATIPIIAFSGSLTGLLEARKAGVGFSDFLVKPVGPAKLVQTIQAHLPPLPPTAATPTRKEVGQGRHILVVAPNPIQQKQMRLHLSGLGFTVTSANNGGEAINMARQSRPDAVMCDALMPNMDGFSLCRAIRQDPQLSRVPTVLISSIYLDESDLKLARNVAASAYVQRLPGLKEIDEALLSSLSKEVPILPAEEPLEVVEEVRAVEKEQAHRAIRQLEQQVVINTALAETSTIQAAQLSILVGASEVLTKTLDIGKVLREVLASCLDAGGVSMGAAYLVEAAGRLSMKAQVGYPEATQEALMEFFGHADLLHRSMEEGDLIEVPSSQVEEGPAKELLLQARAKSLLILPLLLNEERMGAVVMVSAEKAIERQQVSFANAVRGQIAQAVALSRTLSQIEYQATHDPLTDLPNRVLLHDRLRQAVLAGPRDNRPFALFMMDLDRFKEVNDTLGHRHGDLLLQQVALSLQGILRVSDTIARLGGDEFAMLLPNVDAENAALIARKILKALQTPFLIEGLPVSIGASIGIVIYPDHGENPDTLLQRADVAMYVSKERRHTYTLYLPDHDKFVRRRLASTEELNHAIGHDQLFLLYQPKVSFATSRAEGLEALVRWNHPHSGVIFPDQFIGLAEQTGLINALTQWTFNAAFRQCLEWHQAGWAVRLAMNLSAWKLHDPRLPDQVSEALQGAGIAPSYLELEITENGIMTDPTRATEVLTRLKNIGVYLSIDNFGKGYSSLSVFKKLPIDLIKIDKSFVVDMAFDADNAKIVRSAIDLAHNLGFKVLADGVENQETWERLAGLGCDLGQGYYMGRPMPPADIANWMRESPWGPAVEGQAKRAS